jgi:hypothetical protein
MSTKALFIDTFQRPRCVSSLLASLLALNGRLATGPNGKCLRGKSRDGNQKGTARPLLPLRATGDSCVGSLRDLLHVEAAGRRILWWTARSGSRARWLPLPRLWRSRTGEAFDHRPSSGSGGLGIEIDDLTLSWLSCQGGAHEYRSLRDEPFAAGTLARAAHGWPGTNHACFQRAKSVKVIMPRL